MKTQHTPTPWNYNKVSVVEWTPNNYWLLEQTGKDGSYSPIRELKDLEKIVNSHAELVESLKRASMNIQGHINEGCVSDDEFQETWELIQQALERAGE